MPHDRSIDLAETSNQISGIVYCFFGFFCGRIPGTGFRLQNGIADGMRKGAQFSSWQITSTAHRTCVCGRSHDNQGKENKTSHHHRTNKRAQSEHKQVHAACNTNTFCAISKSLIQSHAAIENRHANNTPGIKVARTRFLCVAQCAPSQPM